MFGGQPFLQQRNESFEIKESMAVHCRFVRGKKPGYGSGFDIDEADLLDMEQCHGVVVASAIFGNYDVIQQPKNISEATKARACFYMFVDEETEVYIKNSSTLDSTRRVGLWRVIIVRNLPYVDSRRNGKMFLKAVIIREHTPVTNLFTCLWFNEVDRFTARDQLSFSTVRHRIMSKVNWTINMFMDCERRNFVVQAYHRDLLEQRKSLAFHRQPPPPPPQLVINISPEKPIDDILLEKAARGPHQGNFPPTRHGRDRRSCPRRHRPRVSSGRDSVS